MFYGRVMNNSFIGGEMMILRSGDLNPNGFSRGYSGTESLKQAMLQHELIFRNQVRELHRLYWIQKNLMNELHWKCFNTHSPSSSPVALTKWKGSTEVKNELSESSCVRENLSPLEQFRSRPAEGLSDHVINFSLHLPADEFIRGSGVDLQHILSKSNEKVDATEKDTVGCGFEEVIAEKEIPHCASSFFCQEVIDLEASVDLECHEQENEVFFGFRAPIWNVTDMVRSQKSALSDQVSSITDGDKMNHISSLVHLDEGRDGRLQEQKHTFSFAGLGESSIGTLVDHSRTIQQDEPVPIDLNIPLDERSLDLNDPAEDINLRFVYSVVNDVILEHDQRSLVEASLIRKPASSHSIRKARCDNEVDCMSFHGPDAKPFSSPNSKLTLDVMKYKGDTEIMIGTSCQVQVECCGKPVEGSADSNDGAFINVNAVSFSPINPCKQGKIDVDFPSAKLSSATRSDNNRRQDSNITTNNSTNLSQYLIRDSINKLSGYEGSEEDTLSSHAVAQGDDQHHDLLRKFSNGCNSVCKTRKIMCKSRDKIAKEFIALSYTNDSVTTSLNSSQMDGSSMEKLMPVERDLTISAAAEVLMGLSSERSAFHIDHQPIGVELQEVHCDNRNNQPLHSSDSFECMTLQLSEVQTEDHFCISEPLNQTEGEKNVNGLCLRRGRGLRDFQKEILPGLASLARHEICADLHNIGHKLRRNSSRNARENWFVPVQGRRSRLYSWRRRN